MLHSIAYLISGLMLFSFTLVPNVDLTSEQVGRDQGQGYGQGIHGKVVDAESQEPIANATVRISGSNATTETDQDGTFFIAAHQQTDRDQTDRERTDQPADRDQTEQQSEWEQADQHREYTLVVSADGYEEEEVEVSLPLTEQELTIELQPND